MSNLIKYREFPTSCLPNLAVALTTHSAAKWDIPGSPPASAHEGALEKLYRVPWKIAGALSGAPEGAQSKERLLQGTTLKKSIFSKDVDLELLYLSIRKLKKAVAVSRICSGFSRKTPGNSRENCWKNFPESPNATNSRMSGTRKVNLPRTLGPHCRDLVPTFRAGCFLKPTVPAFSSFS